MNTSKGSNPKCDVNYKIKKEQNIIQSKLLKLFKLFIITMIGVNNHILFILQFVGLSTIQLIFAGLGFIMQGIVFYQFFNFYQKQLFREKNPKNIKTNQKIFILIVQHMILSIAFFNSLTVSDLTLNHSFIEITILYGYLGFLQDLPDFNEYYKDITQFLMVLFTFLFCMDFSNYTGIRLGLIIIMIILIILFTYLIKKKIIDVKELFPSLGKRNYNDYKIDDIDGRASKDDDSIKMDKIKGVYQGSQQTINCMQQSKRLIGKQIPSIETWTFLELIDSGIVVLDYDLSIVFTNPMIDGIFSVNNQATIDELQEIFDDFLCETVVKQIDKKAKNLLYKNLDHKNLQRSINTDERSRSNTAVYFGMKKSRDLNVKLIDFINDMKQNSGLIKSHFTQIITYQSKYISDKQYVLKIEPLKMFDHAGKNFYIIIFDSVEPRDRYLKRRYTYKVMKRLFKSLSHEFGTSLNCIMTHSSAALHDQNIEEKIKKEYFQKIEKSSLMLLSITNDMRDYNQMLGRTFALTYSEVNLRSIISDVVYLFKEKMDSKKLEQNLIIDQSVPQFIMIDRERLKQVLVNIISNSYKFTMQGYVNVKVSMSNVNTIKILIEDSGIGMTPNELSTLYSQLNEGFADHSISKNSSGFGMGLYISNFIVRHFSQSKTEGLKFTSNQGEGFSVFFVIDINQDWQKKISDDKANIGPYIVTNRKEMIDSRCIYGFSSIHNQNLKSSMKRGKKLSLHDEPKAKTELKFRSNLNIPDQINFDDTQQHIRSHAPSIAQEFSIEFAGIQKPLQKENFQVHKPTFVTIECNCPKILVVDDDVFNIFGIQKMLEQKNIKIDTANNGVEALQRIKQKSINKCQCKADNYQIIFMDVNMPIMDGLQASLEIKQKVLNNEISDCVIIACTAFVDLKTKAKIFDSKMDHYMSKPVKFDELIDTIKKYNFLVDE